MNTPSSLTIDERVAVVAGHIERRVGPLCFVLAPDGQMHSFDNATAVEIWDLLVAAGAAGTNIRELARALGAAFEVEEAVAVDDIRGMLEGLVLRCVVQRVG
jgi:hypothetical protein